MHEKLRKCVSINVTLRVINNAENENKQIATAQVLKYRFLIKLLLN